VEYVLQKLTARHASFTSALTFYELEESLYALLAQSAKGTAHAATMLVPAARSIALQAVVMVNLFAITILDLTKSIVDSQIREITYQLQGIRSADALHLSSAISLPADIFITTDQALIALDGTLTNAAGNMLRCVDTDVARTLI
jgi:hypothetical protein